MNNDFSFKRKSDLKFILDIFLLLVFLLYVIIVISKDAVNTRNIISICLFFFAYSTIIGWYFFGEQNVRFLFTEKGLPYYRVIVCIFIVIGATLKVDLVWSLADLFNGLMVIPNLIALLVLHKVVVKNLDDFESKLDQYQASLRQKK